MAAARVRTATVVAVAAVGVLSGCAAWSPPPATPSEAPIPAAWRQPLPAEAVVPATAPGRAASTAPSTASTTAPDTAWWTALGDAEADALVAQALLAAPDLRTATARLREVRARAQATQAATGPSLSAGLNASRSRSSGAAGVGRASTVFDAGFDARWEADLFGRSAAGVAAAGQDVAATTAALADVQLTLAAEVLRQLGNVRLAQWRQAVARDSLARQADTLQIARWRAQAGLVSTLDVAQAEATLAQTQAQAAALDASRASAELSLERLLGVLPGSLSPRWAPPAGTARPTLPALPAAWSIALPADVLRQRPDLRQAEAQWRAEAARTRQAHAAQFPSLTLSGSIGLQALTLGTLGQGGYGSIAAALAAPIFDGGQLRAQLAAQVAVRDRAALAYEQAALVAIGEVEDALAGLDASRRQAAALAQAVAASGRAVELTRLRYRSGLVDMRSVLDAERSLLSAEDSLGSARTATVTGWVALHKALGTGGTEALARAAAPDGAAPAPAPASAASAPDQHRPRTPGRAESAAADVARRAVPSPFSPPAIAAGAITGSRHS